MLVHPQNLPPKTLFAIDQFVLKGGKALVFVDPHSELQAAQPSQLNPPGSPTASNLAPLFKAWGFQMLPNVVAGDRRDAAAGQRAGAGPRRRAARLHRLARSAGGEPQSRRHDHRRSEPYDDGLGRHSRTACPAPRRRFEPLITTSPNSTKIPVDKLNGLPDVAGLLADFRPDGKRYILAAHVTGMAADRVSRRPAKAGRAADAEARRRQAGAQSRPPAPAWLKQSAHPINVVVVADTDLLDDRSGCRARISLASG